MAIQPMIADARSGSSPWPLGRVALGRSGQNPTSPGRRGAGSLLLKEMEQGRGRSPILVGTCNWVDHEDFYPDELRGRRQRERLAFYARYFPLVEIDSSFYGIPNSGPRRRLGGPHPG